MTTETPAKNYVQPNPRLLDIWSDLIMLQNALAKVISHARNKEDRQHTPELDDLLRLHALNTVKEKEISDSIFIVLNSEPIKS